MKTIQLQMMAAVTALFCAALTATVSAQDPERCIAQVGPDGSLTAVALPGFSVMNAQPPLTPPQVDGELRSIVCARASISIAPHDHRVITDLNVPLFLTDGARLMVLEMVEGQLRTRFVQGEANEAEFVALQAALERAQIDIQPAAAPPPR